MNHTITTRPSRWLLLMAIATLVASIASTTTAEADGSGRKAIAHRAGAKVAAQPSQPPRAHLSRLDHGAGEPTIAIAKDGDLFITAVDACVTSCPGSLEMIDSVLPGNRAVFRSSDGAATWQDVTPSIEHAISLDPYIYIDDETQRVFSIDLVPFCSHLSFTDDDGESWQWNPLACGEPINDHHTVFSGAPITSATQGYPNIVYFCFHHFGLGVTKCSRSLDGGETFTPTASIAGPECSGLNGHGVTDKEGVIYIPLAFRCGRPMLAISRDEGATWETVPVSQRMMTAIGDPSVAVDAAGNLYYLFIENQSRLPYLATSRDGGKTWSRPIMVGAPNVKATNLATIDVGKPGRVAMAYYGTTFTQRDSWTGYLGIGRDVLGKNPLFYSAGVTERSEPLKIGDCGPGRCGRVLDFIDVEIDPNGRPWGTYVDACLEECEADGVESIQDNQGLVATMRGGFPLR